MKGFTTYWRSNSLMVVFEERLTVKHVMALNDEWIGDARFDKIDYFISDLRKVTDMPYSEKDYKLHAAYSSALSKWHRNKRLFGALVVSSPLIEEKANTYISVADNSWTRRVFYDIEAAERWANESSQQWKAERNQAPNRGFIMPYQNINYGILNS